MLQIQDLHAYYGPIEALRGIDLQVPDGSIVCLIGSNGAGKTTLLKAVSGFIQKTGSIRWNDKPIEKLTPKGITKCGVLHVPEGRHVFPGLSVQENLEMGSVTWHGLFGRGSCGEEMETVFQMFPKLKERRKQLAWSLSGGEQQMLAIGRAMMGRPKILMLDEPSMGLAPLIVEDLFTKIAEINKQGLSILLVEQNARMALEISDYTYVIEQGNILFSGPSGEISQDPRVLRAYLGKFAQESNEA